MKITPSKENIFTIAEDNKALYDNVMLVNPVNCVGTMGAGLAKQFRDKYPSLNKKYIQMCKDEKIKIGNVNIVKVEEEKKQYVVLFPTKNHYNDQSQYEYIAKGMESFIEKFNKLSDFYDEKEKEKKDLVIFPAIGCGLGGLSWLEVCSILYRQIVNIKDKHFDFVIVSPK